MANKPKPKRVVYVMAIPRSRVKIGVSKNRKTLKGRPRGLNAQYGFSFDLRYAEQVPNASLVEKALRNEFRQQKARVRDRNGRQSREIFRITPEHAISALKRLSVRGSREVILSTTPKPRKSTGKAIQNTTAYENKGGKVHAVESLGNYPGKPRKTYTACGRKIKAGWNVKRTNTSWRNAKANRMSICKQCVAAT